MLTEALNRVSPAKEHQFTSTFLNLKPEDLVLQNGKVIGSPSHVVHYISDDEVVLVIDTKHEMSEPALDQSNGSRKRKRSVFRTETPEPKIEPSNLPTYYDLSTGAESTVSGEQVLKRHEVDKHCRLSSNRGFRYVEPCHSEDGFSQIKGEDSPVQVDISKGSILANIDEDKVLYPQLTSWNPFDETKEIQALVRSASCAALAPNLAGDAGPRGIEIGETLQMPASQHSQYKPWLNEELRNLLRFRMGRARNVADLYRRSVHVELSPTESNRLPHILSQCSSAGLHENDEIILSQFPGRTPKDVQAILQEYQSKKVPTCNHGGRSAMQVYRNIIPVPPVERRIGRRQIHKFLLKRREVGDYMQREHYETALPNIVRAHRIFQGTSGDVNASAFSPDGSLLAIGCVATNDEYNRAGNLSLMRTGIHGGVPECEVLDARNTSTNKCPTISSVAFVRNGSYLIAGSIDQDLKIYSAKGRFLHDKSRKNRICTHDLSTSRRYTDLVASCHGSGHLDLHKILEDGTSETVSLGYSDRFAPAIAAFNDVYKQLVVGYQPKVPNIFCGQASIIDVESQKEIRTINGEHSYAHISVESSGYWIAGTNTNIRGIVSVYDPRALRVAKSFVCNQQDINVVSMMDHYVTSAATDGTCHIWDIRKSFSGTPLHILKHGTPKQAYGTEDVCGITGTTFFTSSSFITGSSDGFVKLWNLNLAQPHVKDLVELDSPITCLSLSLEKDQMMIGENIGTAHLWSIRGDGRIEPVEEHRPRGE